MFYLNVGYQWKLAVSLDSSNSAIFLASANDAERLERTTIPDFARTLLDPQLYLAELDATKCKKVCARLASFPWFCVRNLPEFQSGEMNRTEWNKQMQDKVAKHWLGHVPKKGDVTKAARSAIEYQERIGCSHIILPSPLIKEREGEGELQGDWLDACLKVIEDDEVALPILATVAIDEITLNDEAFEDAGFLDTIVDQVSSREGIDGVYIVVAQTQKGHPFDTPLQVARAYARLCDRFSEAGVEFVLPNFADMFGLVCRGYGATGFCNGPSHSQRRLCLQSFQDDGRGLALPHLYSHRTLREFRSEADLDKIVSKRLFRRVRDVTEFSQDLVDELDEGGSASNVPPWVESRSNTKAATQHFIARNVLEEAKVSAISAKRRMEHITDWLERASSNNLFISKRLGSQKLKGQGVDADGWLDIVEQEL